MCVKEFDGRTYEVMFGSDVQRNGVYLELSDRTGSEIEVLAEVFFYDEQRKFRSFVGWVSDSVTQHNRGIRWVTAIA